ncbi:hypothetical protein [Cerasicoccus fimbriatus]|uniref:hypothetical protein n=1 Tax=Cerasicoccus fimbriatus TaxID=3014554 RepID=UPI0022B44DFA|nr:hypothetical protein [Cerasicoccus sp. TK19100]
MKINWIKALLAGVIGTLLFDVTGFLFTSTWWDIPHVLADAVGVPFPVALLMHYGNGVALAAIYAALAPSLFGPGWFRALVFTTLETVMLVWFLLFPLLGLGIAGLEGGLLFPVLSMTRHWLYAVPLAYYFPVKSGETAQSEMETDAVPCG